MNKVLFFLLFLGIIFSFYHKYTTVIENLKCDPNKAKVYPESGKRSEKECQRLGKGKNSRNLKSFEKQLDEVKELLSKVKTEILDMINKHKENSSNINKAADSLNCYEDKRTGDFDCDNITDEYTCGYQFGSFSGNIVCEWGGSTCDNPNQEMPLCSDLNESQCTYVQDNYDSCLEGCEDYSNYALFTYQEGYTYNNADTMELYPDETAAYNGGVADTYADLFVTKLSVANTSTVEVGGLVQIAYDFFHIRKRST